MPLRAASTAMICVPRSILMPVAASNERVSSGIRWRDALSHRRVPRATTGGGKPMAESVLRLGVVGAGRRAQQHFATLRGLPDLFQVAAICDANPEVARRIAAEHECD